MKYVMQNQKSKGGGYITVLLYRKKTNNIKSLSMFSRQLQTSPINKTGNLKNTKALQYACLSGSLTLEAALVTPLLLFFILVFLHLFLLLGVQLQVSAALQHTARSMAASYTDTEEPGTAEGYLQARHLFWKYMGQRELLSDLYRRNRSEISFIGSDFSGDFIKLYAAYEVKLPVFWEKWGKLPVKQQVVCKKWTGASVSSDGEADGTYVYITPYGKAYHSSAECKTLKLSIQSVPRAAISALRSEDGNIYYPCRCAGTSSQNVYITDYGTEYHGNIACSGLKRTVCRVLRSQVGDRHLCMRCQKEG